MFENFVSYKTDERQMISDTSTIEDTVEAGSNITITDYNLSLLRSIDDNTIEYPFQNLLDEYADELKAFCIEHELTDEEFRKYKYRPDLFAYDLYGIIDYEFIIMKLNGINKQIDFDRKKVKYIDPDTLEELLGSITNAEEELLTANRETYITNNHF